jgi:hypothetical protein
LTSKPLYPAVFILCLSLPGCGHKEMHQVKGTIVFADGSDPAVLARGLVLFDPVDLEVSKSSARGEIQADGTFRMSTATTGDGVAPGKYRVMINPPRIVVDRDKTPPQVVNERFRSFETSGLEITVDQDKSDYVITVAKP